MGVGVCVCNVCVCVCVCVCEARQPIFAHAAPMDASHTPSPMFSTPGNVNVGFVLSVFAPVLATAFCWRLHHKDP